MAKNPENNFNYPSQRPHQSQIVATYGSPIEEAKAAMVMMHGRGATAEGMFQLADAFDEPHVHYVAPQAQNYSWYPYSFLAPVEKNEPGRSSGLYKISGIIADLKMSGFSEEQIILLGFSQGACLTLEYAARHPQRYGGVVGLSGGLIGSAVNASQYEGSMEKSPVFLGCSDIDPHIPQKRVDETENIFNKLNADVTKKFYENMGHTIIQDEIKVVKKIMKRVISKT